MKITPLQKVQCTKYLLTSSRMKIRVSASLGTLLLVFIYLVDLQRHTQFRQH